MTGNLGYDPAAMKQGQEAVDRAHNEIRQLLSQLQSDVDTLKGGWQSSASTQFQTVHTNWQNKTTEINKALEVMHQKLGATDRTYTSTESQQTDQFTALNRF